MKRNTAVRTALAVLAAVTLTGGVIAHAQSPAAQSAQQPSKAAILTGNWAVDSSRTEIGFTVIHMGVNKVRGRFSEFDGAVKIDGAKPANSSVQFTIQAKSIDTGNTRRDAHLRNEDFFDVEKYPTITFKSTKVTPKDKGFTARGPLTMHGVTKVVELPFTVQGPDKGEQGEWRLGVDTSLKLDRTAYGLTWNRVVEGVSSVSNEVDIAIHLELVKK
jgi:Uncharacterized conserved protein